jgi:hypothetical protein
MTIAVGEWHDYVTERRHGKFKAGTKCKVTRDERGRLVLKFGKRCMTLRKDYYAKGIEVAHDAIGTEFALAY